MALISFTEAASRAGVNVSTIHRQVKKGVLAAVRDERGRRRIDVSELARVYPQSAEIVAQSGAESGTAQESATVVALRAQMELLQRQVEDMQRREQWYQEQMQRLLPGPRRSIMDRLAALWADKWRE